MRRIFEGFTGLLTLLAGLVLMLLLYLLGGSMLAVVGYVLSWISSLGTFGKIVVYGGGTWLVWVILMEIYFIPWSGVSSNDGRLEDVVPWLALALTIATGLVLWFRPMWLDQGAGFLVGMVVALVINLIFSARVPKGPFL